MPQNAQPLPQPQGLDPKNPKETETKDLGEHLETGAAGRPRTRAAEHQETEGTGMGTGDPHLMGQGTLE